MLPKKLSSSRKLSSYSYAVGQLLLFSYRLPIFGESWDGFFKSLKKCFRKRLGSLWENFFNFFTLFSHSCNYLLLNCFKLGASYSFGSWDLISICRIKSLRWNITSQVKHYYQRKREIICLIIDLDEWKIYCFQLG